jgi:hypothetical protein
MASSDESDNLLDMVGSDSVSQTSNSSDELDDSSCSEMEEIFAISPVAPDPSLTWAAPDMQAQSRNSLLLSLIENASSDTLFSVLNTRTAYENGIKLQSHQRYYNHNPFTFHLLDFPTV